MINYCMYSILYHSQKSERLKAPATVLTRDAYLRYTGVYLRAGWKEGLRTFEQRFGSAMMKGGCEAAFCWDCSKY